MRKKLTRLIKRLCDDFGAEYSLIDIKTRKVEVVLVRQVIFYFVDQETDLGHAKIGEIFNKDRITARHSIKRIQNLLDTKDRKFCEWYRLNEIIVRRLIDMALNSNAFLIRKKYRHYEMVEMVAEFFGEQNSIDFEKHMINETIRKNEHIQ